MSVVLGPHFEQGSETHCFQLGHEPKDQGARSVPKERVDLELRSGLQAPVHLLWAPGYGFHEDQCSALSPEKAQRIRFLCKRV